MAFLEGDLSEFPLTDIIQLIDLSKKTGTVELQGQRGTQTLNGRLYFRDGKIIGAEMAGLAPLEAAYTFFTFTAGPFKFRTDIELPPQTIMVSNEVIIMEGVMRQDRWASIQERVPSLSMVPRLVPNPASGMSEINLEAEEWRVLTMVDGKNTIERIARRSGLGEFRTCEIIAQLLANGLIEKRETNLAEMLFPELERMATTAIGNTARTLFQEAYKRAGIEELETATGEQALAAISEFEDSVTLLIGPARARQLATEMRNRTQQIV
jgi:hypothetical protein